MELESQEYCWIVPSSTQRSREEVWTIPINVKLTSKMMSKCIVERSKSLARGLMGVMKGAGFETLIAFVAAGEKLMEQFLYES